MTTEPPPAPARQHAPWTLWLTAACVWIRAAVGVLAAVGMGVTGLDLQTQTGEPSGGFLAVAVAILLASAMWVGASVSFLRRQRAARLIAVVFEAVSFLFAGALMAYTDGTSLIAAFLLVFGAPALIAILMGPSIEWCKE
jgi:hypothetical protein